MLKKTLPVFAILSLLIVLILINITTPSTAGPFVILAVFLSAYVFFLCVVSYAIVAFSEIMRRLSVSMRFKKPLARIRLGRAVGFSGIVALAPIMIVGMQSVGAGGFYGLLLVVIFVVGGCLYVAKTT